MTLRGLNSNHLACDLLSRLMSWRVEDTKNIILLAHTHNGTRKGTNCNNKPAEKKLRNYFTFGHFLRPLCVKN